MPADLADLCGDDVVLRSDRRVGPLRRLAAGERVNEEIGSMGRSRPDAVGGCLAIAIGRLPGVGALPSKRSV